MQELKVKIENYQEIEERLKALRAKFVGVIQATDTYFNQPEGLVLKIVEDDRGNFLSKLKAKDGKFEILDKTEIKDVEVLRVELKQKYGIKRILKKERSIWELDSNILDFNLIEGVGDFLILKSNNPKEKFLINKLGLKKLDRVTVPFSEL